MSAVLLVIAFGLGTGAMAGLMQILPDPAQSDSLGNPMNWFPSMLATLLALGCFYGAWAGTRISTQLRALSPPTAPPR